MAGPVLALLVTAVASAAAANSPNTFRLNATVLGGGGNLLLVGRYHVSNPPYCLETKPSYRAENYDRWTSPRCVPYTVQRAAFTVSVKHNGKKVVTESFGIDGAYGDPVKGGTFTPYYLYCGLLASAAHTGPGGTYLWAVTMRDPFHRAGYDVVERGVFRCH